MNNIVLLADDNNMQGMYALINSVIQNCKNISKIKFNVLVYNNKKQVETTIKTFPSINYTIQNFIDYPEYVKFLKANLKVRGGKKFNYIANIMNFARFYIDSIFPELNTVLYLDTDTIVQVDINNLFESYEPVKHIASPININLDAMEYSDIYDMKGKGFNAGVYLINLTYWRTHNLQQQMENIIKLNYKTKLYKLGTQPLINLIYYTKCTPMDKKWNFRGLGHLKHNKNKIEKAYIIHWSGQHKPWLDSGMYKEYWNKYKVI